MDTSTILHQLDRITTRLHYIAVNCKDERYKQECVEHIHTLMGIQQVIEVPYREQLNMDSGGDQVTTLQIQDIRVGDVLARVDADGVTIAADGFYRVLRVLRKQRRVDVVSLDGYQSIRALCEFAWRWNRHDAKKFHLQWRI